MTDTVQLIQQLPGYVRIFSALMLGGFFAHWLAIAIGVLVLNVWEEKPDTTVEAVGVGLRELPKAVLIGGGLTSVILLHQLANAYLVARR